MILAGMEISVAKGREKLTFVHGKQGNIRQLERPLIKFDILQFGFQFEFEFIFPQFYTVHTFENFNTKFGEEDERNRCGLLQVVSLIIIKNIY